MSIVGSHRPLCFLLETLCVGRSSPRLTIPLLSNSSPVIKRIMAPSYKSCVMAITSRTCAGTCGSCSYAYTRSFQLIPLNSAGTNRGPLERAMRKAVTSIVRGARCIYIMFLFSILLCNFRSRPVSAYLTHIKRYYAFPPRGHHACPQYIQRCRGARCIYYVSPFPFFLSSSSHFRHSFLR